MNWFAKATRDPKEEARLEADWRIWAMNRAVQVGRDNGASIAETAQRIYDFGRAIDVMPSTTGKR